MTDNTYDTAVSDGLREDDHDRYLLTLMAPSPVDRHLVALYEFNNELAKTRSIVSEPMLGEIRLQWWRETLEGIYAGTVREHDVSQALAACIEAHHLDREALLALIDARGADIDAEPMATMDDLVHYAAATGGLLEECAATITGEDQAIAHHAGTAWALVGLCRALPYHLSEEWNYLPQNLLRDLPSPEGGHQHFQPIVEAICGEAVGRIEQVMASRARHARLVAFHAGQYLALLRKGGYDTFNINYDRGAAWRLLRLGMKSITPPRG